MSQPQLSSIFKKLVEHNQQFEAIRRETATKAQVERMTNAIDKVLTLATR